MHLERKALYNLLRMNWLRDPHLDVKAWQVEDYRHWSLEDLFERLEDFGIRLDDHSFHAYSEPYETPEELNDELIPDDCDAAVEDQIYLLVFELWRRLIPEKRCLSIFCDELDYQVNLYDRGEIGEFEHIQDVLANLAVLLDEGLDQGADPIELFDSISTTCANDIESFLYDFIAEQVEDGDPAYAGELIDTFYDYVHDVKWLDFLRARICSAHDIEGANEILRQIYEDTKEQVNLDLDFEMLSFLVQGGDRDLFLLILKRALAGMEVESDFQDLLGICADYFACLDQEKEEAAVEAILNERAALKDEAAVDPLDPSIAALLKTVEATRNSPSGA